MGWLPVLDFNVCGLKIAGEAVYEATRRVVRLGT
jgi:hypothetical protein